MQVLSFNRKKEFVVTAIFVVCCLVLYGIFPTENTFQEVFSPFTFLFLLPFLYIKFILKKNVGDFGMKIGDFKKGMVWSALSLAAMLLIFYAIYHYTSFSREYSLPKTIAQNFWIFLTYELLLVGAFSFFYEFFFRGFIFFNLYKKFDFWAIFIQWFLFTLFFMAVGNFDWINLYYFVIALFSGIITYKSRSIWYSFVTSILFVIIADAIIIALSTN